MAMQRVLSTFLLWIFSLRYRFVWKGIDLAECRKEKSLLFLPNHPSKLDSVLMFLFLQKKGVRVRPIGIEYIFQWPWFRPFLKRFRVIPIPHFKTGVNQYKLMRAEKSLQEIVQGLRSGENFLLFPAGKTKKSGVEVIGGTSATHRLIQECPEARGILIRITGFWGSSFSKVPTEHSSEIRSRIRRGMAALLKHGIFFLPRRDIVVEVERLGETWRAPEISKREFNRHLEHWYNQYPDAKGVRHRSEPLQRASWDVDEKREEGELLSEESLPVSKPISPRTSELVYAEIRRILNHPSLELSNGLNLSTDLGMDSLNVAELVVFLSRHTKSKKIVPEQMQTVQDVLELAERGPKAAVRVPGIHRWPKERERGAIVPPEAPNIPQAILQMCQQRGSLSMCADDFAGVLSYRKFGRAVRVLAKHFASFAEERIAVLLPAAASTYIVVLALQWAGKVPVMLNWTLGPRYLDQMMEGSGAERILTSWNFVDRLQQVDFGKWAGQLQFLEHIRSDLSLKTKLSALFGKLDGSLVKEEAVILFTSGSESMPKGVPLTHQNILANLRSLLQGFPFTADHISYSTLPPFHSLGFTVAGLFPLLLGLRTAFYPDPTDALGLAEGIHRWEITHLALAPTFLKGLLSVAKKEELATMQIFVSGGERTPPELFEQVSQLYPHAKLVEGYGVTECSPCIALDHPSSPHRGVGKVIPGIEILSIHPETQAPLPEETVGEICICGPNVFRGYLAKTPFPFIDLRGKRWYRTGDLGYVDREGYLILSGRLKRFVKVGAEMISLVAIEEVLAKPIGGGETPSLAVSSRETQAGKPEILLFSKLPFTRESAHEILRQAGFSHLVKIDRVIPVEEIPVSSTGKIDYQKLLITALGQGDLTKNI